MRWQFIALVTATFALGCGSTQPTVNPFLGPMTVPPPGTGEAIVPTPGVPYYQGSPPPGAAPNYSTPSAAPPQQYQTPYVVPGGTSRSDAAGGAIVAQANAAPLRAENGVVRLDDAFVEATNVTASATTPAGNQYVATEPAPSIPTDSEPLVLERPPAPQPLAQPVVPVAYNGPQLNNPQPLQLAAAPQQVVQPPPARVTVAANTPAPQPLVAQPRPFVAPTQFAPAVQYTPGAPYVVVQPGCDPCACQPAPTLAHSGTEITDLPPAGTRRAQAELQERSRSVQAATLARPTIASADTAAQPPVHVDANVVQAGFHAAGQTSSGLVARYGYDTSYNWVRGKLEYLAGTRQWKLRYIPIDGDTDDYGGSVVIANPDVLVGREANDFVTLRGGIVGSENPDEAFAPLYRIERVEDLNPATVAAR
ncbi:MAG: hypothetical protein KDA42_10055 [Planctomycetales bacterium]|nr:hypothetical protein [Planctomycetales bacterium]